MEAISKAPKLLLVVDHSGAGSNERFHALYHACVESIEHFTNVAIQLRTSSPDPSQETALIKPLIEHHRAHHNEIPLHINALSAEMEDNCHTHLCRARWQSSRRILPPKLSASLDQPSELETLMNYGRPDFLIVGPVGTPLKVPGTHSLRSLCSAAQVTDSSHRGRRRKPQGHPWGSIPRCDGYAILTPVLNALDAPAKWRHELESWKLLFNGETI